MPVRRVQISIDEDLLAEVDREPEARERGRSAVIRKALRVYLDLKRRKEIDESYDRAYAGREAEVFEEFAELLGGQTWPEE